ncbi:lipoyl synthase [Christensenella tenuis]|uniref:Lipoyl synthase n=1 Tax=Christensenella tenuis TaxID=2763033 RepID=A0ABR7EE48_9FIRM|nr:lipoyl synthase [Christensenella tenuis]MBC5648060.1 lipoyl synthase [Christensenella tenuis]
MQRKPKWLSVKYNQAQTEEVIQLLTDLNLNTVCSAANCPNLGECYSKRTATFMIMGDQCTRNCRFCNVTDGKPAPLSEEEPYNIAKAVVMLKLKYVVITSVTRDDLPDGGAMHFSNTVRAIKDIAPDVYIELLIPDLKGDEAALDIVMAAKPDVLNHNTETVRSLYSSARPQADYDRSLHVLNYCKRKDKDMLIKTGLMVGLGETDEELLQTMDDIRTTGCDILTIGQYLRPSKDHLEVVEYVTPEKFKYYEKIGLEKGFSFVASAPLVRSSYKAELAFTGSKKGISL